MTVKALSRTDFAGGIGEQYTASAAAPDSVSKAKGFVLDGTNQLRTQWDCEDVTPGTLWSSVRGFRSETTNYIVGVRSSDDHLVYVNADTDALTDTGVVLTARHNPWAIIPRSAASYTAETLVDGSITSESSVTQYAGSGILFNSPVAGDDAVVAYETSPGVLATEVFSTDAQRFPSQSQHPSISDLLIPTEGVVPHARLGVMWDDRLILADILWYSGDTSHSLDTDSNTSTVTYTGPTPLSAASTTRYHNGLWVSEPGDVYSYSNISVDLPVSADSRIVDLAVIDIGLLVLSTTSSGKDGLLLLRGTPSNYNVIQLRPLSGPRGASDTDFQVAGDLWAEIGTFSFVAEDGGIYMTNGQDVVRLDGPTSINHTSADWDDHVHCVGSYMFVSHSGRLLVMRSFGATAGAWTELSTPKGNQVMSMTSAGGDLYFLQSGVLYRYVVSGDSYGAMPASAVAGADEFTVATSTYSLSDDKDGRGFSTMQVHRSGLTLSSKTSGSLVSLTTHSGPALSPEDTFTVAAGETVDDRFEYIAKAGVGFVNEASVEAVVTGDVTVESVSVWLSPGKRSW